MKISKYWKFNCNTIRLTEKWSKNDNFLLSGNQNLVWIKQKIRLLPDYALLLELWWFLSGFSIWVFFHEHSRFAGQQGKGEGIFLTPLYHFHPLHRHLDISRAITAESSPLHIAGSRTQTGNLWLPSASC